MRKKRILAVTEFTQLNTGYSTYYNHLLKELYKRDDLEITELACYCDPTNQHHQRLLQNVPWRVIGNMPGNDAERQQYNSHPANEFGKFRFEYTCLETQPDIIIDIRDWWQNSFLEESVYRRLYQLVMMPTLDGNPIHPEWISTYQQCDGILTYTDWSKQLLEEQSGGTIKVGGVAPMTADESLFKPISNKSEHRQRLGLRADAFVVGFVARNQKRKLYPDLAQSFSEFVQKLDLENTENTYLYFHCAFPDLGHDIPQIIKSNGVARKVLMTYWCQRCNGWFPAPYQDATTICRHCGSKTAVLSNSQFGVDRRALADIYNLIDLYVQYTTNEGFGAPNLEAAFAGCIVCGTDYAGTTDINKKTDSYAIPVKRFNIEPETGRNIAYPDNDALVNYIRKIYSMPESMRQRIGQKTAELARKNFGTWQDVAGKWMEVIDNIPISENNPWLTPPNIVNTNNIACPSHEQMNDEQFVNWAVGTVLGRSEWINSWRGLKLLRDLGWGRTVVNNLGIFANELSSLGQKPSWEAIDRNKLLQYIIGQRNVFNQAEMGRQQYIKQGRIK